MGNLSVIAWKDKNIQYCITKYSNRAFIIPMHVYLFINILLLAKTSLSCGGGNLTNVSM